MWMNHCWSILLLLLSHFLSRTLQLSQQQLPSQHFNCSLVKLYISSLTEFLLVLFHSSRTNFVTHKASTDSENSAGDSHKKTQVSGEISQLSFVFEISTEFFIHLCVLPLKKKLYKTSSLHFSSTFHCITGHFVTGL